MEDHSYYQNRACAYFPCHAGADAEDFNCQFCYCPLYLLGADCGGDFTFTADGVKDCTGCLRPHLRENREEILARLRTAVEKMKNGADIVPSGK